MKTLTIERILSKKGLNLEDGNVKKGNTTIAKFDIGEKTYDFECNNIILNNNPLTTKSLNNAINYIFEII
jgi:hypothetical protein